MTGSSGPVSPGEAVPTPDPDDLDTFGENTAALVDIARALGIDEDTSAPDIAFSVRAALAGLSPVAEPRRPDDVDDLLQWLHERSEQGGADGSVCSQVLTVIHGLRDELDRADAFGRGEFRVTQWAYDQALRVMREAQADAAKTTAAHALCDSHARSVVDLLDDPQVCDPGPRYREAINALRSALASSPATEGAAPPPPPDPQTQAQAAMERVALVFSSHGWDDMAGSARLWAQQLGGGSAGEPDVWVAAARALVASAPVPAHPGAARPADGAALIAAERARQTAVEGWTREHDDEHGLDQLASAAACYALPPDSRRYVGLASAPWHWPWHQSWWKPCPDDRLRELVKAGALIAAEIDRLSRVRALLAGGDPR